MVPWTARCTWATWEAGPQSTRSSKPSASTARSPMSGSPGTLRASLSWSSWTVVMPTMLPEAWMGSIYAEGVSEWSCPMESPDDREDEISRAGLGPEAAAGDPTVDMVDQADTAVAGVEADPRDATAHAADHHAVDRLCIKEVNPIHETDLATDPATVPATVPETDPAPTTAPGNASALDPGVPATRSRTPVRVRTPGLPRKAKIVTPSTEIPRRGISKRRTVETRLQSLILLTQEGVCLVLSYEITCYEVERLKRSLK